MKKLQKLVNQARERNACLALGTVGDADYLSLTVVIQERPDGRARLVCLREDWPDRIERFAMVQTDLLTHRDWRIAELAAQLDAALAELARFRQAA